jgi:protein-disulfide isomerase
MSYESAFAAECVRKQDENKYWSYHSMLFDHQEEFTYELFISFASELDLNIETFTTCYNNQETKEIVDADIVAGTKSNIYGTPTLFINNQTIVGPKTYRELKKVIESELD